MMTRKNGKSTAEGKSFSAVCRQFALAEIAEPRFGRLVRLARDERLLELLLAGSDQREAQNRPLGKSAQRPDSHLADRPTLSPSVQGQRARIKRRAASS